MSMRYDKLFILMEKRQIKKYDLRKTGLSPTIVSRLVKNEDVNTSTISKTLQNSRSSLATSWNMSRTTNQANTRMSSFSRGQFESVCISGKIL